MERVTTCPVDDGEPVTTCVRPHLGLEQGLWQTSLCL